VSLGEEEYNDFIPGNTSIEHLSKELKL